MEKDQIMDELVKTIRFTFGVGADTPITGETVAFDIDGWDYLSHATLMIMVEKKFAIRIGEDESNELANVGALRDLVYAKLGRPSA